MSWSRLVYLPETPAAQRVSRLIDSRCCALIAHRGQPTLVIVDRQALLEQWTSQVSELLGLEKSAVGRIGGARNRPSGVVDLAMAQSLAHHDDLAELAGSYGFAVVDECHHVPAATFEAAVKRIPARAWLGLTATPTVATSSKPSS